MQNWSTVRKTWKEKRDGLHVAKGAAGTKYSIGGGIDAVATAQAKGLKSFIEALGKFDMTMTDYKKAIGKLAPKAPKKPKDPDYPGLLQWIDKNLAKWIKDDKAAAKAEIGHLHTWDTEIRSSTDKMIPQEGPKGVPGYTLLLQDAGELDAKAAGKKAEEFREVKPTQARLAGVFDDWVKELDDIIRVGGEAKQFYGPNSTVPVAKKLADLRAQARELKRELTVVMPKAQTWNDVLQYNQRQLSQGWLQYHLTTNEFDHDVKARIGP